METELPDIELAIAVHDRQLSAYGGLEGIRDRGALESALSRPLNLSAYGDPSLADIAASLAFGIARNHPFIDGNKRTSLALTMIFLRNCGLDIRVSDREMIAMWQSLAAGAIAESDLADWLSQNLTSAAN